MATGDVTFSLVITGSVTKTVTLSSAIRTKSKNSLSLTNDAEWAVREINEAANIILSQANAQLESEATWTRATFTAAT